MATHLQSVQRAFRKMNLELAEGLRRKDCEVIIYLEGLPTPDETSRSNFHLAVLSSLEANGHVTTWKVDRLEGLLFDINRQDLLPIITRYKESKDYKDIIKERKKRNKKGAAEADIEPQLLDSSTASDKYKMMKSLYTLLIMHTTELTRMLEIVGEVLGEMEEENVDKAMEQFLKVAKDGEEFAENLHKVFRDMGINPKRYSSSSEDTPAATPTDTENRLLGNSAIPLDSKKQHSPASPSKYPCKKPVPLPRKHGKKAHRNYVNAGPIRQEEGYGAEHSHTLEPTSLSMLPYEEAAYDSSIEAEEEQDDSGIGNPVDWAGGRALSEEPTSQDAVTDPGATNDDNYCHGAHSEDDPPESAYMALLPSKREDAHSYTGTIAHTTYVFDDHH